MVVQAGGYPVTQCCARKGAMTPCLQTIQHVPIRCPSGERKGNAEDARYYNELMTNWHAIVAASMDYSKSKSKQLELL
ncbi:MAG: hypothetical protein J6X55_11590 [Victivallales bacterium]|nr:hypothetical protein [Victivallales bacterium]